MALSGRAFSSSFFIENFDFVLFLKREGPQLFTRMTNDTSFKTLNSLNRVFFDRQLFEFGAEIYHSFQIPPSCPLCGYNRNFQFPIIIRGELFFLISLLSLSLYFPLRFFYRSDDFHYKTFEIGKLTFERNFLKKKKKKGNAFEIGFPLIKIVQ